MNKKWLIVLLGLIVILGFYKYTTGNFEIRKNLVADTLQKLESEGYSKDDISSIKVQYNWFKDKAYNTYVIFKDEPDVRYRYYRNKNNKIQQSGYAGNAQKHLE